MTLLTLTDLHQFYQEQQSLLEGDTYRAKYQFNSADPVNFQLLMKQLFLGLPVQPFLETHPKIAQWVSEVKDLLPQLFERKKKFWIDVPILAPLGIENTSFSLQAHVNYGLKQGIPRLYEWAVRPAQLTWQDTVKLWLITTYYAVAPEKLSLVVIALHPTLPAQKLRFRWDQTQHNQTQQWLMQLLIQPISSPSPEIYESTDDSLLLNWDAIPEVPL